MGGASEVGTAVEVRIERIIEALRGRGQRITPQRLAVLQAFLNRTDHPSADAILEEVRRSFPLVAPSTVYHTLRTLIELNEAVEVCPAAPHARFDPNTQDHCHLVCLACQAIVDVPLQPRDHRIEDATLLEQHGFQPGVRVHQVTGICRDCRGASAPAE